MLGFALAVLPLWAQAQSTAPPNWAHLAALAKPAIVHVFVEVDNGRTKFAIERPSSGVIVDASGLVVTWLALVHEAEGASDKRIVIALADREATRLPAKIVATDRRLGLALLRTDSVPPAGLFALELADSSKLAPGEPVLVLSRPDTKDHVAYAGVVSHALGGTTLSGTDLAAREILLTDAMIEARCHGAALLDSAGRLLGLCNAAHVSRDVPEPTLADLKRPSFGFVIPTASIRSAFAKEVGGRPVATPAPTPAPTSAAVARVAPALVSVWAGDGDLPSLGDSDPGAWQRRPGLGSGVIVTASGLVLTNAHLVGSKKTARITLLDGRKLVADVQGRHAGTNMALLQIQGAESLALTPAIIGDGSDAILGETVLGVGNPLGTTLTVTIGVLSAKRANDRLLQADPNLGNQNAGGALIDVTGRLIGIVDGGIVDKIDLAYARQGDRAKTETNLSSCVDLRTIRQHFDKQLEELLPKVQDPAQQAVRATAVTAVVARRGPAMLNVYVSRTSRKRDEDANPFAEQKQAQIVGESLGSGVIVDRDGLAVTNWHVVDAATEPDGSMRKDHVVSVRLWDGSTCEAAVLSISREDDLALLQLTKRAGQEFTFVEFGDSTALRIGEGVIAIGNPMGFANTITAGIVTAKDQGIRVKGRWAKLENLVETDAAINGGNSGGALLDHAGKLVGINSAGSHGFSSHGYAIPGDHVKKQVHGLLLSPEKLRSVSLGMSVAAEDGKLVVKDVDPRGPAGRAGISAGDHVASIDKTPVSDTIGYARALLRTPSDVRCRLEIVRGGKTEVTLVQPLAASAWAVLRQTGAEASEVSYQAEPELVRDASLALHRHFTGNAKAEPTSLLASVVRVERTTNAVLKQGDLLLGAEFQEPGASAETQTLRRFTTLAEVQACFNDPNLSSYDGKTFRCWIYRDKAVQVVALRAKRLFL